MNSGPSMPDRGPFTNRWLHGRIQTPSGAVRRVETDADIVVSPHRAPLVVLKIGGSLLSRPRWPTLIASLIDSLMAASDSEVCCVVVGGGCVVDGLRTIDQAAPQSPRVMHDLAIDAMRLTARLVCAAVSLPLTAAPPDSRGVAVLDVPTWLAMGSQTEALPVGWHVTSDAIAASVAVGHGGSLVLAKSVPPPPCPDGIDPLSAWARAGWVDEHFPVAAAPLATIEWAAPTA